MLVVAMFNFARAENMKEYLYGIVEMVEEGRQAHGARHIKNILRNIHSLCRVVEDRAPKHVRRTGIRISLSS